MRLRLVAVLLTCGVFGFCLAVSADDRKADSKADPKPADAVPADAKPADPKADPKADKVPSFKNDVAPLLKSACSACHTGFRKKGNLDIESYTSIMKFVKPGEPDKSKLHNALIGKDAKPMPPKNPLADDQIAVIKAWIAAGAKKD